jgi:cytochrome c biogenesis protein CcdA/thiol-disulfide isomerase/thioredoxin
VALLILYALIAGAATALSPCILPVLPAVLAAGATGGRRRPLGVVLGLTLSFTFATVALVYVIDALGLPEDITRTIAIVVLIGFGIILLIPPLADRVEAFASGLVGGPKRAGSDGFWSGVLLGGSLGFVYAPCAGPILAGVITVSATQSLTAEKLAVALAYGAGSGIVLYVILLGGRRITDRLAPVRGRVNAVMGALMIAVAVMLATNLDITFENWLARSSPAALINPTQGLESSKAIAGDLNNLRDNPQTKIAHETDSGAGPADAGKKLPVLGRAPDFTNTEDWFNSPPLSLAKLRGKVVLVDFWTYTCINCLRPIPHLEAWYRKYHSDGFVIVGVHTPEFPFEKIASNVEDAIGANGITYPVVQDNEMGTWNAYGNQYWPAHYLIDAEGNVREVHFGEGAYGRTEEAIRSLLAERGAASLGAETKVRAQVPSLAMSTPETYLGGARAQGWAEPPRPGTNTYNAPAPGTLPPNGFAYGGRWSVSAEDATAAGTDSAIEVRFGARRVFLVLGSPRHPRRMRVLLDGKPIPEKLAGPDVHNGVVTVDEQRLYSLVNLPRVEQHRLTLKFAPGINGYAFTFG